MDQGTPEQILVTKFSTLGDFVVSLGAMQAIRRHHRDVRITLLTTRAYAGLAEASGCFDQVWIDHRPSIDLSARREGLDPARRDHGPVVGRSGADPWKPLWRRARTGYHLWSESYGHQGDRS